MSPLTVARRPLPAFLRLTAVLLLGAALLPAAAQTRLNDDASPRNQVRATTVTSDTGLPLEQSPEARFADARFGRIEYKLDTEAHIGKDVRVYYAIPADIRGLLRPAGLTVSWRGAGGFRSGSLHAGERQLVWSGRITEPFLTTSLEVTMRVDLSAVTSTQEQGIGFEPYFEIE